MGWKGVVVGSWIGGLFGGALGSLLGAALGHQVEKRLFPGDEKNKAVGGNGRPKMKYAYAEMSAQRRAMIFCASAAAMLAKMAKADGVVTADEIASVEEAFARLGFDADARAYAVNVFRRAKDDAHTIYEYAGEFAGAVSSYEVRELFYEILWDLACADGRVSANELEILRKITNALGIRSAWFDLYREQRLGGGRSSSGGGTNALASAYATLGVSATASDADVKKAYRELAKKNHPDALRAQGLPDEMVGKATERMSRINAAWATIREARGL